ncbi:hypothetical protein [Chitinilyticum piscinae]|uniref:Uncharacterized protein n=1 Tax=Chitinilyticum piscinae TaxID=2866724 RepID=A0A8J7FR23_9NEIS|nr:hypothetical protein [Chitinilyticum piscinae]MBE9609216.1 hypothetical protein [Chitinilyticum piscinae]
MNKTLALRFALAAAITSAAVYAATTPKSPTDTYDGVNTPDLLQITPTPGATNEYIVSEFTFQPSANVSLSWNATATSTTGATAGDMFSVGAFNVKKGNRTFAGAVGAFSSAARACQNTNPTGPLVMPPIATQTDVEVCTF